MASLNAVERGDHEQVDPNVGGLSGRERVDVNGGEREPTEWTDRTGPEVATLQRLVATRRDDGDSSSDGEILSPEEWRRRQQAFIAELPTSDTGRRTPDVMTDEEDAWDLSDDDVSTNCTLLSFMDEPISSDEEDV